MKKTHSILFKSILVSLSFVSIYNMFYSIDGDKFAYFTNLSNLLVFITFLIVLILNIKDYNKGDDSLENTHLLKFKGTATLCITITFLIYAFLLAEYNLKSNYTFQNLTVHYIVPILVLVDYFLFDKKGTLKWYNPLLWMGICMLYIPFIFIRAAILGPNTTLTRYPYFFLNLDKLGGVKVTFWIIGIIIVFTVFAYLIYLYDCKKGKK